MRPGAGLHRHRARRLGSGELEQLGPYQPLAERHMTGGIRPMGLENPRRPPPCGSRVLRPSRRTSPRPPTGTGGSRSPPHGHGRVCGSPAIRFPSPAASAGFPQPHDGRRQSRQAHFTRPPNKAPSKSTPTPANQSQAIAASRLRECHRPGLCRAEAVQSPISGRSRPVLTAILLHTPTIQPRRSLKANVTYKSY